MKYIIRKLLREALNNDVNYFKDKTSIHDYDKLLAGKQNELPAKYKNQEANIDYMSKNEYLRKSGDIQNIYNQEQYIDKGKVEKYKNMMFGGIKFDMPYLNYVDKQQEGRHRVVAADEAGQNLIPVLVIEKTETEDSLDSKIGEWTDLTKGKYGEFLIKYNLNDYKEIIELERALSSKEDNLVYDIVPNIVNNRQMVIPDELSGYDINRIDVYSNYHFDLSDILPPKIYDMFNNEDQTDEEYEQVKKIKYYLQTIFFKTAYKIVYEHNYWIVRNLVDFKSENIGFLNIPEKDNKTFDDIDNYASAKEMLRNHRDYNFDDEFLDFDEYNKIDNEMTLDKIKKTMAEYPYKQ